MENLQNSSALKTILRWILPITTIIAFAAWMYVAPEGAMGKLSGIGYAVCHRIDERSFHINGEQLPLCARCTGEFYAAALAIIFQAFASKKAAGFPSRRIIALLFIFFLAFGIDGTNSYIYLLKQSAPGGLEQIPNLYIPNNILRLFTGSGMGIALAAVLFPVVNQTLWREQDNSPALDWKKLGILIAGIVTINLLILTESPFILYPIAYISALGTLSLLVIVFSMLWLIMMREDNSFDSLKQAVMPTLAGLTLALLMVVSIDYIRYALTGTWSGMPGLGG